MKMNKWPEWASARRQRRVQTEAWCPSTLGDWATGLLKPSLFPFLLVCGRQWNVYLPYIPLTPAEFANFKEKLSKNLLHYLGRAHAEVVLTVSYQCGRLALLSKLLKELYPKHTWHALMPVFVFLVRGLLGQPVPCVTWEKGACGGGWLVICFCVLNEQWVYWVKWQDIDNPWH